MKCLTLCSKLWNASLVFMYCIDVYCKACNHDNNLIVFTLKNQNISVNFGWNCLGEFSKCLMEENAVCEVTFSQTTKNQTYYVNEVYSTFQYTNSKKPKTCIITPAYEGPVLSCSRLYTHGNGNGSVLLLRENKSDCFRTGFVPLDQWSILEKDFVIQSDYNGYYSSVCTENIQHTTLKTISYGHTTDSMFTTNTYSSVSSTDQNIIAANISTNNTIVGINNQGKIKNKHSNNTMLIALCVVFSVLILSGVFVGLFIHYRKRNKQKASHNVINEVVLDNIVSTETTKPLVSNINWLNNLNFRRNSKEIVAVENIKESNSIKMNISTEANNKDNIEYETYNAVSKETKMDNDTFLSDNDGYLVPSRDRGNTMVFQNSAYSVDNDDNFENSNYEDVEDKKVLDNSLKCDNRLSDSVYDVYNSESKLHSSEEDNSYQNVDLDQPMRPIDGLSPNNNEDNEIQGVVLEEFEALGESRDYENLETVHLDQCNYETGDFIMDETLLNNSDNKNVYYILEDNK